MNRSSINDHNEPDFIATCDELLITSISIIFLLNAQVKFKDEASFLKSRPNLKTFLAMTTYGTQTEFMCWRK